MKEFSIPPGMQVLSGVFAIAFAVCVVKCLEPKNVKFISDSMRDHLLKCMSCDSLTLFPMLRM